MRKLALAAVLSALCASPALAQNSIVGTWKQISAQNGRNVEGLAIYTADGHFTRISFPADRSTKAPEDMSKEELVAAVRATTAQYGTYTVSGNTLTRRLMAGIHRPAGTEHKMTFKVEGDALVMTFPDGNQSRYERLK